MTNEPRAGKAIDPETLAAYIDKRLSPDERAVVEAQLATDRESHELLVELMKAEDELGDVASAPAKATPAPVVPMPPRASKTRRWIVAGGVLAAAAALVLVVRLQPDLLQRLRGGEAVDPLMAKLVEAVGEERYIEARLSGGFKYGPLRSVTRGPGDLSQQNLSLLAAAGGLQKAAQDDPSLASLHAWGVAQLLLGDYDGAVEALQRAADDPLAPAAVEADLAAALLARSGERGLQADLPAALDAAQTALERSPASLEPRFNRALALELLKLTGPAAEAWRDYLKRDTSSPWAEEARRRLERLTPPVSRLDPFSAPPDADIPGGEVADIAQVEPSRWRFLMERVWLPLLCSHADETRHTALLVEGADQYYSRTGDRLWVEVMRQPHSAESCDGYRRYARALALLDRDELAAASIDLEQARERFQSVSNPLGFWAEYHLASLSNLSRDFESAEANLVRLVGIANAGGYASLGAHAQWTLGVVLATTNRFAESLEPSSSARDGAERAHEPVLLGRIENQLADILEYLGDTQQGWNHRKAALQVAADVPNRRLRHSVYGSAAAVTLRRGLLHATSEFLEAQYSANQDGAPAASRLTLVLRQIDLAITLGDTEDAARRLGLARQLLAQLGTDPRSESLQGRLTVAQARLALARRQTTTATALATTAMPLLERGRGLQLVDVLLIRAHALQLEGRSEEALSDLKAILAYLQQRRGAGDSVFGSPELQTVQDGVDRLLENTTLPEPSLELAEEGRRLVLPMRRNQAFTLPADPHSSTLYFKVLPTKTRVWRITAARVDERILSLSRAQAIQLVGKVRAATDLSAGAAASARQLTEAFSILIAPFYPELEPASTIRLVADWPLDGLPFAALRNPATGRFLIEDHALVMAPLVSPDIRRGSTARPPLDVFVVADPVHRAAAVGRLDWAATEGPALAALYRRSSLISGAQATAEHLLRMAPGARIVHIAAHAIVDRIDGRRSRLLLADDKQGSTLSGEGLVHEDWSATDVVVLAACSTAEPDGRPASPMTLASQVLSAGPAFVIATLRPIDDRLSSYFFVELHKRLAGGMSAPDALRQSQIAFINNGRTSAIDAAQALAAWSPVIAIGS